MADAAARPAGADVQDDRRGLSRHDARGLARLGLLALGLLLALAPSARAELVSPGPLAEGHKKLDDANACQRCHGEGSRVVRDRCLSCHTRVETPLLAGRGFHAKLIKTSGKRCEQCHPDHRGRSFPLIRWSPPADFDHAAETGFKLRGAHGRASCAACHKRRPSYMGAKTACASCHSDPHDAQLGRDCARCHGQERWRPASGFSHAKTSFPLDGRHEDVACASCHRTTPGPKGPRIAYKVPGARRCETCHGDPHRGRTALSSCRSCHSTAGWRELKRDLPPAHGPAGYPLVGKHAEVGCKDCHGSALTARVERRCASCHEDAHRGRFGGRCERCHDERGWKRLRGKGLAGFDHDRTRYPLKGKHRRVACKACHRHGRYRGLRFDRCDRCHDTWHPEPLVTVTPPSRCEACHTVAGFTPSTFGPEAHAKSRYPLTGAHLASPCARCHTPGRPLPAGPKAAKATLRPPTPLHMPQRACADCHADPHKGQFDARMRASGRGCEECHGTSGWRRASSRPFDHDKTRFPLRGVHAKAACASCHKPRASPPGATESGPGPTQYVGLPLRCQGCHRDPHLGQFTVPPPAPKVCEDCHDQETFKLPRFDHAKQTRYPLDGKHVKVSCDKCHPKVALRPGLVAVHYRVGRLQCADCHQNPHQAPGDIP